MSVNAKLQAVIDKIMLPLNPLKGQVAVQALFDAGGIGGLAEHIDNVKGLTVEERIQALKDKQGGTAALEKFKAAKEKNAPAERAMPKAKTDHTEALNKIAAAIKDVQTDELISNIKKDKSITIEQAIDKLIAMNGITALEKYEKDVQIPVKKLLAEEWSGSDAKTLQEQYDKLHKTTQETNVDLIAKLKKEVEEKLKEGSTLDIEYVDKFIEKTKSVEPGVETPAVSPDSPNAPPDPPDGPPGPPDGPPGPPDGPPGPPPGGPSAPGGWSPKKGTGTSSSTKPGSQSPAEPAKLDITAALKAGPVLKKVRKSPAEEQEEIDKNEVEADAAEEEADKKAAAEDDNWDDNNVEALKRKAREVARFEKLQGREKRKLQKAEEIRALEAKSKIPKEKQEPGIDKKSEVAKKPTDPLEAAKKRVTELHTSNKEALEQIKKAKSYTPELIKPEEDLKKKQDEMIKKLEAQKKRIEESLGPRSSAQNAQKSLKTFTEELLTPPETPKVPETASAAGSEVPPPDGPPGPPGSPPGGPPDPPDGPPGPPGSPPGAGGPRASGGWSPPKGGAKKSAATEPPAPSAEKPSASTGDIMAGRLAMNIRTELANMIGKESPFKKQLGKSAVQAMMGKIIDVVIANLEKDKDKNSVALTKLSMYKGTAEDLQDAVGDFNISDQEVRQGITNFYAGLPDTKKQELQAFYTAEKAETSSVKKDTGSAETPEQKAERANKLKAFGLEDLEPEEANKTEIKTLMEAANSSLSTVQKDIEAVESSFTIELTTAQTTVAATLQAAVVKLVAAAPTAKPGVKLPVEFIEKLATAQKAVEEDINAITASGATTAKLNYAAELPKRGVPEAEINAEPVAVVPTPKEETFKPLTVPPELVVPPTKPKDLAAETLTGEKPEVKPEKPKVKPDKPPKKPMLFSGPANEAVKPGSTAEPGVTTTKGVGIEITEKDWIEIKDKVEAEAAKNKDTVKSVGDKGNKIRLVTAKIDIENKGNEVKVSCSKRKNVDYELLVANYKITAGVLRKEECSINVSPSAEVTVKLINALVKTDPKMKPVLSTKVLGALTEEAKTDPACAAALKLVEEYPDPTKKAGLKSA